jgi:hypothetical protein
LKERIWRYQRAKCSQIYERAIYEIVRIKVNDIIKIKECDNKSKEKGREQKEKRATNTKKGKEKANK